MTDAEHRRGASGPVETVDKRLVAGRRQELTRALGAFHPEWDTEDLELIGGGLEFLVFRSRASPWGPVAIRTPRERWISNDNDPSLDARELLEQEASLLRFTRERGLGSPDVHAFHRDDRCDFLVMELVEGGDRRPEGSRIGDLARRLHSLEPPERRPVVQSQAGLGATLARRIDHRRRVVERIAGIDLALPPEATLAAMLDWPEAGRSLLHMDLRPANLLVRPGGELAPIDWSNALVGDPALELARIAELGHHDPDFLAGYGTPDPLSRPPAAVRTLYRLDAALMLSVVFLSEAPDVERGRAQTQRVEELAGAASIHA